MYVKKREYKGTEMSRMDGAQRWPVVRAGERRSMWKVGWEGKQVGEAAPALIYDRLAADGRANKGNLESLPHVAENKSAD